MRTPGVAASPSTLPVGSPPLQKYASQINAYRNLPIAVDRILDELTAGSGGLR